MRASLNDSYVVRGDRELNRVALKVISQAVSPNPCDMDAMDFDVHILHSPTDNLLTKSEALEILLRSGIHPLVAIKVTGLWTDAEKIYMQSKPYLDALWKTVDDALEGEIAKQGLQAQVKQAEQIVGGMNGNQNA